MIDRLNALARRVPAWTLYIVLLLPVPWLLYLALNGGLGRDPLKGLEHELGQWALQLMIAGLAITPLRRFAGLNLIGFRRAIGVVTFIYVALHFAVWLFLDVQIWSQIWADILKRPFITIGFAAFVLLIPLAVTSNNWSIRKLGPVTWRRLHKLVYVAALLGGVHYVWLVKGIQVEPLVYMAIILALLALRLPWPKRAKR
ncbi:protein-methionine-sulfoxide reductase heme-binding subunit MsrQ [Pseudosulfitobacter koreensis]|uniref:Protein-methionine-sulfoxide reductase heme-binding subunit MsrQ n=1 Tax=Pseudosulfitobacter koreensis TaxID=2968472 RepID=A0ABT1Z1D9_9RHOB|nr:protein-methionine-sulfoxide reductase heme-binding subunit MsrQ [Pseudosulfitobacter koreense]MCR8826955.1 protein-methionine-sulfoxide reductase heme-binding subunit MsrQ [Pseudosulfitobacter koreense]